MECHASRPGGGLFTGRKWPEFCVWIPPGLFPNVLLPFTDFSLYPFLVINCNHEYSFLCSVFSSQFSVNSESFYQIIKTDGGFGILLKLVIGVRSETCLVGAVPLDLAAWLTLVTEQGSQKPSAGIGKVHVLLIRTWWEGADAQAQTPSSSPRACSGQYTAQISELFPCPSEWESPQISMSAPCWWPNLKWSLEGNKERADWGWELASKGRNEKGYSIQASSAGPERSKEPVDLEKFKDGGLKARGLLRPWSETFLYARKYESVPNSCERIMRT